MTDYCFPEAIKSKYLIKSVDYECKNCKNKFNLKMPLEDDIVKLIEKDGTDIKWLPTYGKGGFLDLVKKLVPEYWSNTMVYVKKLEPELLKYTEKGKHGKGFILGANYPICPNCKNKEVRIISEKIIENPTLDWVQISCELINR
jgi:hypothetical protein